MRCLSIRIRPVIAYVSLAFVCLQPETSHSATFQGSGSIQIKSVDQYDDFKLTISNTSAAESGLKITRVDIIASEAVFDWLRVSGASATPSALGSNNNDGIVTNTISLNIGSGGLAPGSTLIANGDLDENPNVSLTATVYFSDGTKAIKTMSFNSSAVVTATATLNAKLLYANDFEGNLGDVWKMMGCYNYTYTLVSPARSGNTAARHTMKGQQGCTEFDGATVKHRAQLMHGKNTPYGNNSGLVFPATDKGPFWFGFSIKIPSNFPTGSSNQIIGFDIKDNSAFYGETTSYIRGNQIELRSDGKNSLGWRTVTPDVWHDIVLYVVRSKGSDGVVKGWIDGQVAWDFKGPTMGAAYPDSSLSFFRTGIYWGLENRPQDFVLYYDDVKIAKGGSDGYNLVKP